MKINKQFLLTILLISLFSTSIFATDYYVSTSGNDNNNGTSSSPFRTIQHAVDEANAGDNIYVYGGTYGEKVKFSGSSDSGSSGNLVTLTNVSGQNPIIDGSSLSPSGREGLITVQGSSYIKISGFEIRDFTSSGDPTPCGFYMDGTCTQVEFSNNRIHDIVNTSTCSDPCGVGAHGIGIFGTTSTGIKDVVFDNNEVYNNILQASEAFVINGNVNRFLQTNNYVHDNNNIGFDYIGYEDECSGCGDNDRARNGIVRGNRATNNRSDLANPWYQGDASAGGFYVDGGADILFENNISNGNNMGFEVASEHDGKSTENVIVRNNYVYNNSEVGISIGGSVSNAPATNISVINNTFYKNNGWGSEIVFQSYVRNSNIQNNIFFANNTDAYEDQGGGHSGNSWSNNLSFNGSATPGSISTSNPQLANPGSGNLDLSASSPAINAGSNSASDIGTKDIKGNNRVSGGTVDIGAHEYGSGGSTPNTLTVSSLNEFSNVGASQSITVTSNVSWTVSENSSWVSVNTTSGSNNGSVGVTASPNTATSSRTATITISGGNITRSVSVSQEAGEETTVDNLTVSSLSGFSSDGGAQTISVSSNVDWTVSENLSWITLNTTSGSNNGSVRVTASANTATSTRSGTLTISGGDITRSVTVSQAAADDENDDGNIALNGTASQSTTAYNGSPSRAIDGNTNGVWRGESVTHTIATTGSWWQVALNQESTIGDIVIYNRTDSCCRNRLSNFTITVTNSNGTTVFSQTITETPNPSITVNAGDVTGNTVRITTNLSNTALSLAEVEVYGESSDDGGNNTSCTVGANLSLNGTIANFSSEQNTTNGVANLIDGNDSSRWSADGFPQSAVIDLGAEYAINEISLTPYQNRAYQFLVEGSTSSANAGFSVVTNATGNTSGGSLITRAFTTQTVRYVKLTITGASGYSGTWSSIADFKIICAGTSVNLNSILSTAGFDVTAYPNPSSERITVKATSFEQKISSVQLVDLSGKIVMTQESSGNDEVNLNNFGSLANGVYLLRVLNTEQQIVKVIKIIKN